MAESRDQNGMIMGKTERTNPAAGTTPLQNNYLSGTVPTSSYTYTEGNGGYGASAGGNQAQSAAMSLYEQQRAQAEAAYAERDAARQRAYDAIVGGYQDQFNYGKKQANDLAGKSLQEAYISKMMGERNLGQQLAALGRKGGAAETTLLNMQNAYGRERGEHERTRADTIAQLQLALNQGKADALANLENARADDAVARFETMSSLEQQFAEAVAAQQRKSAAALAGGGGTSVSIPNYGAGGSGVPDVDMDRVISDAMAHSIEMANDVGHGAPRGQFYRNYLEDYYNKGRITQDQLSDALTRNYW